MRGLRGIDAYFRRERIDLVRTQHFLDLVGGNWLVFSHSDPREKRATLAALRESVRQIQNRPNRGARARKEWRGSLAKVIKKAVSIAELLTEADQEENLRVIREAKQAVHRVFDFETKETVFVPDHKTRLAATMLDLAYREGKPVERQISAHGDVSDFPDLLRRLQSSPAAQALEDSEQKTVEGKEIVPILQGPQGSDH